MKIKLGEYVEVVNPIPVKKSEQETEYKVIFPANIVESKVTTFEYGEINLKKQVEEKYFLKENDILFQVKGTKFESILITETVENLLPSNSYLILRVDTDVINPKYLQWLLKTKTLSDYFEKNTSGAIIKLVRKNTITDLEINLPSLEEQEEIVKMILAFEKEKENTLKYLEMKEELIEAVITEKYKGEY